VPRCVLTPGVRETASSSPPLAESSHCQTSDPGEGRISEERGVHTRDTSRAGGDDQALEPRAPSLESNNMTQSQGAQPPLDGLGSCRKESCGPAGQDQTGAGSPASTNITPAPLGGLRNRRETSPGPAEGDPIRGGSLASSGGRPQAMPRKRTSKHEVDDSEDELAQDIDLNNAIYASDRGDTEDEDEDKDDDSIDDDEYHPSQDSTRQSPRKRRKLSTLIQSPIRHAPRRVGNISQSRSMPSPSPSLCSEDGAVYDEWPLQDVSLKRVTEKGTTTFQLQFAWNPCRAYHERKGHGVRNARRAYRAVTTRSCATRTCRFTSHEDTLIIKLKEDEHLRWDEIHRRFSSKFPGRSKGALQVRYSTKLKSSGRGSLGDVGKRGKGGRV